MKKLFLLLACGMAAVGGCNNEEFDTTAYNNIEIQCTSKTMDYKKKFVAVKNGDKLHIVFYNLDEIPPLQFTADYPLDGRFAKRFFKRMNPARMVKMSNSTSMELTGGRYDYNVKLDGDENSFTLYAPCSLEVVLIAPRPQALMANTDAIFEDLQSEASRRNSRSSDDTPTP